MSWTDTANLTKTNLQTSFNGHRWIIANRQKTGTEPNIRLLEVAKHIIEKYDGMAEGDNRRRRSTAEIYLLKGE